MAAEGGVDNRPMVLVLLGCFGRGIEATGPNQNLLGMVRALSGKYRFRVAAEAVPGDRAGEWQEVAGVEQIPLTPGMFGAKGLRRLIDRTPHVALMTNGFFDRTFTIVLLLLRRLGLVRRRPVILGVHGEFSPGALAIRGAKKARYIELCRRFSLLDGVILQATAEEEAQDIRKALPFFRGEVVVTPVIRSLPPLPEFRPRPPGAPLRVVFLSRIDRKKHIEFAIDRLGEAGVPIAFDIYGPVTDAEYWAECQQHIERLPGHVRVTTKGTISQAEVLPTLAGYDLFFLPTWGENYGHAIVDALCAGTPILISDRTPWRGLREAGAGWDLPLSEPAAFVAALREVADQDRADQTAMRAAARRYAETALDPRESIRITEQCLDRAAAGNSP